MKTKWIVQVQTEKLYSEENTEAKPKKKLIIDILPNDGAPNIGPPIGGGAKGTGGGQPGGGPKGIVIATGTGP